MDYFKPQSINPGRDWRWLLDRVAECGFLDRCKFAGSCPDNCIFRKPEERERLLERMAPNSIKKWRREMSSVRVSTDEDRIAEIKGQIKSLKEELSVLLKKSKGSCW